jgi:exopolyphosphatase/guanosine-5'-triphosphate,3'-diphosphate pyrophosphatase
MRLGVLDIGSNTVHLLLVDAYPGAPPVPFASYKRSLQLVAFLDESGAVSEIGQRELVEFITGAVHFAQDNLAEDFLAFAPSAIREAANGADVLARVQRETGVELAELSGPEEAAATFLAARRWYGWRSGTLMSLDIGGGSFELAVGSNEHPDVALSVPLGAGRLTRDLLHGDPPSAPRISAARTYIRAVLERPLADLAGHGIPTIVAGSSKSFRSLARITGASERGAGIYVPRELTLRKLTGLTNRLSTMTSDDRSGLPGVSPLRAQQLLAAAIVAEEAMSGLGISVLQICPWALREGILLQRFDTLAAASPSQAGTKPPQPPQSLATSGDREGMTG